MKRNLIYHIAPFTASQMIWRRNVYQLLKRIDQFDGRRVVAISTGDEMNTPGVVAQAFGKHRIEFITVPNNPRLRERASFVTLLRSVQSLDRNEATFYAHAKGVKSKGDQTGVTYWRNLMYHVLLDDPKRIEQLLSQYYMIGTHRRARMRMGDGLVVDWHFSGTFWWFRHDTFFIRPWEILPESGWAVEALPGLFFPDRDECFCIAKDGIKNAYNPKEYTAAERFNDPPDAEVLFQEETPITDGAMNIELGGGERPRPGYVNVDRNGTADVQFELESLADGAHLPFEDDSVQMLYSSHCIEHIRALIPLMREIVRICRVGATVEIRVPHWQSAMALCYDHKHVICDEQVDHWTRTALPFWYGDAPKRLDLVGSEPMKGVFFARWRKLMPHFTDRDILDLCPNACCEVHYTFRVVKR